MIRKLVFYFWRQRETKRILQKIRDGVHTDICGICKAYHCSNECDKDIRAIRIMHDIWHLENIWDIKKEESEK